MSSSEDYRRREKKERSRKSFSRHFLFNSNSQKTKKKQSRRMIKFRHSSLSLFNAYLTILVAVDRLFTANCCFKLVFVATKVAYRAMTDMLSKEREREIDDDERQCCANSTPQGKIQREKEETQKRISNSTRVCLSLSPTKKASSFFTFCRHRRRSSRSKEKKTRRKNQPLCISLRVCFLLKLRRKSF